MSAATGTDVPELDALLTLAVEGLAGHPVGDDPLAEVALWCGRVWGRSKGRAVLALGHGGRLTATGKYDFPRFEVRSFSWPDDRLALVSAALSSLEADVYVCPSLQLPGSSGNLQLTTLGAQVAWADVDQALTDDDRAFLSGLGQWWAVSSGTRDGRHVYVKLDQVVPRTRLEAVNRKLADRLDADAGWASNKLLRLPGTLNHKPRAAGQPSVPVRWAL